MGRKGWQEKVENGKKNVKKKKKEERRKEEIKK